MQLLILHLVLLPLATLATPTPAGQALYHLKTRSHNGTGSAKDGLYITTYHNGTSPTFTLLPLPLFNALPHPPT